MQALQIRKMIELLDESKAKLIVLLCHHNADPDAIGSAYALFQLLKRIRPTIEVEIATAQGASKLSKQILNKIMIPLTDSPRIEEANIIILLDTNTLQQLDTWKTRVIESNKPLILIDHHALHPETKKLSSVLIVDENASSTCEIVYKLFKEGNLEIKKDEALALFLGIAFDTKHFTIATSNTFKIAVDLLEVGVEATKALSLLSMQMSSSERIARLKAANRLQIVKIDDWILTVSHVSTYHASSARAMLRLGAHVAIAGGQINNELKISLRSQKEFYKKTNIHLGKDIARPLGKYLHGMGGGHSTAAGVNGEGNINDALKRCINLIRLTLEKN